MNLKILIKKPKMQMGNDSRNLQSVGINGNGDGTNIGNSILKAGLVTLGDISVALD